MILPIKEIDNKPELFGTKAVNLSMIKKIGVRVPSAFVITSESAGDAEGIMRNFDMLGVENVVVRSSFSLDKPHVLPMREIMYNNVAVNRENVISSVQSAFQLEQNRALNELLDKSEADVEHVVVSVIVQEYIPPLLSGNSYSFDPISGDSNKMITECIEGSVENVVNGSDSPNTYIISKATLEVLESTIRHPNVDLLFNSSIQNNLSNIILDISETYKCDVSLHWVWRDDQLYVLQFDQM